MKFEDELDAILIKGKEKAAVEMLKTIEESYGEVPYIFQFMEGNPEILLTKMLHNNAILRDSTLDMRTVELISIAVSAAMRCNHCLKLHIRVARNIGISDEEIATAIFLAGNLVSASVLATATRHLEEERESCRICEIGNGTCEMHANKSSKE
ncbi:MAG: carboxymuconolactone decarboxylase family protein [Methanotrichaceae archaeon]|nr:carboxymuconolactone decarboxylase family protein [Methanotrichaceae archaeon]